MSATITITLQVQISTQKSDKVAVTGSHKVLGEWDPEKVRFLKPKKSQNESDIWHTKVDLPLSCDGLEYRYLVCRKSAHEGNEDEDYLIRHWESGIMPRYKKIIELGSNPVVDVYGQFEPGRKMFVDRGWLINETEIQIRFYKDPIHMFKKQDRYSDYYVKCSAVNLLHNDFSGPETVSNKTHSMDDYFEQIIHSSNPLIRVTSLGKYSNKIQAACGMSVGSTDYVIYKLRTFEPDSHGIKVDFFRPSLDGRCDPQTLGYTNLLPLHLESGSGVVVLAVNNSHGFPIGQVTVRYLVCKPNKIIKCDLSRSFTKWWNQERPTLDIGHRGLGDTHSSDINSTEASVRDRAHENTLGSLMTAAGAADFVEFDVMLSKDKVPIIWHDFKVSILLRKKTRGHHRVHHIPVHELTVSQLQDLRVDFAKENSQPDHIDHSESIDESTTVDHRLSPFPTLKEALEVVDDCVGFYVELKYPQTLYETAVKEDGIESYIERNAFLDAILEVLIKNSRHRRIVLASFDPDVCIMARLKQNLWPVIMLIEDNGVSTKPYYRDLRTHRIPTAISLAKSEKFLGLSVNAASLMRSEEDLLDKILSNNLICFVWGPDANNAQVRQNLKQRNVHAICYDEIETNGKISIYRAEHEERLRKLMSGMVLTPGGSPTGSSTNSLLGSAGDLTTLVNDGEPQQVNGMNNLSPQQANVTANNINTHSPDLRSSISGFVPVVRLSPASAAAPQYHSSCSDSSLNKMIQTNQTISESSPASLSDRSDGFKPSPPKNNSFHRAQDEDYTTDFY